MPRSKHTQRPFVWEAPPITPGSDEPFAHSANIVSATECTGLEAIPVHDRQEAEQYTAMQNIHKQKPQGNIGKGNPRNDPSEIQFHRGS